MSCATCLHMNLSLPCSESDGFHSLPRHCASNRLMVSLELIYYLQHACVRLKIVFLQRVPGHYDAAIVQFTAVRWLDIGNHALARAKSHLKVSR